MISDLQKCHDHMFNDCVAFIPMRSGSKGLPGKNTKLLNGKPLFMHSVDLALAAGIGRILISTDIQSVLQSDFGPNVKLVSRPLSLATDDVPMAKVINHALESLSDESATIVLLQPTSPLRTVKTIQDSIKLYRNGFFDLVLTASAKDPSIQKCGRIVNGKFIPLTSTQDVFSNRQSLPEVFGPNGSVYVFSSSWFQKAGDFSPAAIGALPMLAEISRDIDTLEDFLYCERYLSENGENYEA